MVLITSNENAVALERQWKKLVPSPPGITVSNRKEERQVYDDPILEETKAQWTDLNESLTAKIQAKCSFDDFILSLPHTSEVN